MIGKTLAHYEIIGLLGKGGMGEVYRARDTKLKRDIALKILPTAMSGDPERLARFEREARTLATLQHPNIASIYGFEREDSVRFLVMELAEGEDLSRRIARGPIPVDEAAELAVQLAEGLDAAHAVGIIHRDLKPANIKVTPEGQVKILDFGLARAYTGDEGTESDLEHSPTITAAMTQAGVILGTAAYMSPEQARGKRVDKRADLWAFGVILFEMLTGKQLFAGETVSDTFAAVLRAEIDWNDLPKDTPPNVRRCLRRCLSRNPRERLQSSADARLELLDTEPLGTHEPDRSRSPLLPAALCALAVAIVVGAWLLRPRESQVVVREPTHLSLALPDGIQLASRDKLPLGAPQPCLAISDDGRLIVAVVERDGTTWLYRRFLDQPEGEIVEDTRNAYMPRISPNGKWISFMSGSSLMRVAATGGRATPIVDDLPNSFGHDWINDDELAVSRSEATELLLVDAERGSVKEVEPQSADEEYFWPRRIPGTNAMLFNVESHVAKSAEADVDHIAVLDFSSAKRSLVGIGGSVPRFLPGGPLLLVRDGILAAAPLDLANPEAPLRPITVLSGLLVEGWIGQYAVSNTGTLVYVPGEWLMGTEFVWDDGKGNVEPLGFELQAYSNFELSPDGSWLAVTLGGGSDTQAWVYDLERGARRILSRDGFADSPIWSPDGSRLAFRVTTNEGTGIYVQTLGSNEPPRPLADIDATPYAWHEDVGILVNSSGDGEWGIRILDPESPGDTRPLVATSASEWGPDISPDGKWFAYTSDESGRYEIYARAFGSERSWSVSLEGGEEPIFSEDGKTIYYRYGNRFYATPILEASPDGRVFRAGRPEVVVEGAYSNVPGLSYDVGPDGRLLLLRTHGGTERPGHLNVILDWDVELARKMAEAR